MNRILKFSGKYCSPLKNPERHTRLPPQDKKDIRFIFFSLIFLNRFRIPAWCFCFYCSRPSLVSRAKQSVAINAVIEILYTNYKKRGSPRAHPLRAGAFVISSQSYLCICLILSPIKASLDVRPVCHYQLRFRSYLSGGTKYVRRSQPRMSGTTKGRLEHGNFSVQDAGGQESAATWSWPIRVYRESSDPGHKHARHLASSR